MAHTLKWFLNRIGKRVYRDDDLCLCDACKKIALNGIIIKDKQHASYLHMIENDYEAEGLKLNYRDKK